MVEQQNNGKMPHIIECLYTRRDLKWLDDFEENEIEAKIVQEWLVQNDAIRQQVRWLDKYVFSLPTKMYLSLAWSIIPKYEKKPYTPWVKKEEKDDEFDFILNLIRKHFSLADNDYRVVKPRLIEEIKKDMVSWFSYYGIDKKYWKQYYLNFDLIKSFGTTPTPQKKLNGLDKWGF